VLRCQGVSLRRLDPFRQQSQRFGKRRTFRRPRAVAAVFGCKEPRAVRDVGRALSDETAEAAIFSSEV
jgi:hypothetical protein